MFEPPKIMDLAGWGVVVFSAVLAAVSLMAATYILWTASSAGQQKATERLAEVGSIIEFSRGSALMFAVCAAIAVAIGFVGYCHTEHFLKHRINAQDDAANESRPFRSESN